MQIDSAVNAPGVFAPAQTYSVVRDASGPPSHLHGARDEPRAASGRRHRWNLGGDRPQRRAMPRCDVPSARSSLKPLSQQVVTAPGASQTRSRLRLRRVPPRHAAPLQRAVQPHERPDESAWPLAPWSARHHRSRALGWSPAASPRRVRPHRARAARLCVPHVLTPDGLQRSVRCSASEGTPSRPAR
jgi:hypothetical protein